MLRLFLVIAAALAANGAAAIEQKSNPVSSYRLTLMPGGADGGFFGWLELRHQGKSAGFIYLDDGPTKRPGSLNSTKEYIVTQMPTRSLDVLLRILRDERDIQISYFDPQSPGVPPSVFLEAGGSQTNDPEHLAAVRMRLGR